MAKEQASGATAARGRQSGRGGGKPPAPTAPAADAAPKKRVNPAQFVREVRAEARKITWTSRKETWITTVMVFIMVLLAVVFFWIVDTAIGFGVNWLVNLG